MLCEVQHMAIVMQKGMLSTGNIFIFCKTHFVEWVVFSGKPLRVAVSFINFAGQFPCVREKKYGGYQTGGNSKKWICCRICKKSHTFDFHLFHNPHSFTLFCVCVFFTETRMEISYSYTMCSRVPFCT